jgi:Nucleotidyl transferase AbiEii toxin, Type IV TA system
MKANAVLTGKGLLTPIQRSFLELFAKIPDQEQFYLTGGTALAEYYLGHRLSFDLDFFTGIDGLVLPISFQIENASHEHDLNIKVIRRFSSYVELLVENRDNSLKIDLALDSPFRFKQPIISSEGVFVNDYEDLRVDKLLAYFGRAEPRDAMDLFYILKKESIDDLITLASQKDTGFDIYWFTIALDKSADFPDQLDLWPVKVLIPFDPMQLKRDFHLLAVRLLRDLNR